MGHRLSKIYTRTGDDASTGLGDGSRVPKDDLRVETMGEIDELNSWIGLLLSDEKLNQKVQNCLIQIQHDLFDLGGELSIPKMMLITDNHVTRLEQELDSFNADLPYLKEFILPGGHPTAATCHLARTVCRRGERRMASLMKKAEVNRQGFIYLNRLSDLLFVLARTINHSYNQPEILWQHKK